MQKKSAKDLAFDKERMNYRREINDLSSQLLKKDKLIDELNEMLRLNETRLLELQDWIERLLGYVDLSEDEMRKIIEKDKYEAEFFERVTNSFNVFSRFRDFYSG